MARAFIALAALMSIAAACDETASEPASATTEAQREPATSSAGAEAETEARPPIDTAYADDRHAMVRDQIAARGIVDEAVLTAMRRVPRHRFVPDHLARYAYSDRPLPIGLDQTISQPYIVGVMSELAELERGDKVLEIGTGSGYQAAVLAELGAEVYSIEIVEPLGEQARRVLSELGYHQIETRIGDGYVGWAEHAPFDAVVVTAAPPQIPQPLLDQLAEGGRLVAPVGVGYQELVVVTRTSSGYERETVLPVRFVPMTGRAQDGPR